MLDLSRVVAGPLCGRLLADMGADVVKVEPPDGDVTRVLQPWVDGTSVYFAQMNAGKRNVCVDLKAPDGAGLLATLARHCDVLVENFRPGVLDRAGLGAAELLAANPRLVYCSITGWGQDGPWRDRRSYAPLIHAEAGLLEFAGRMRGRPAEQEVQIHGDTYPALMAANAVVAALFQRSRTGEGQHLDVSMSETLIYMNDWAAVELQRHQGSRAPFDIWEQVVLPLADGTGVALVGNPARQFAAWVRALGGEQLLDEPRFATQEQTEGHVDQAIAAIAGLMAAVPDFATLERHIGSSPLLVAEVRSMADLAATPWGVARPLVTEVAPGVLVPASPWHSDRNYVGAAGPPAGKGQHNRQVLREWCGLGGDEIDRLRAVGALHGADEGG